MSVEPRNADEEHVKQLLNDLDGELLVEEDSYLPLTVDRERVTISGVVDLVHVTQDCVAIVDYKTDRGRHGEEEYRKQLSVYYYVANEVYMNREITASILCTETGDRRNLSPLTLGDIQNLVREANTLPNKADESGAK